MSDILTAPENNVSQDEPIVPTIRSADDVPAKKAEPGKRKRVTRLFPALTYEECLALANAIWEYASGQKIRRLTLFDQIGKSPESGTSRTLITASNK